MPKKEERSNFAEHLLSTKIVNVDLDQKMRKSFLDYSMSVITARALPDVREG